MESPLPDTPITSAKRPSLLPNESNDASLSGQTRRHKSASGRLHSTVPTCYTPDMDVNPPDGAAIVHWAGRIPRWKIKRLYKTDAQGLVDEDLIDEVSYGILARCKSIIRATEAHCGRVHCPRCDTSIDHQWDRAQELICPKCDWRTSWGEYLKTYQGKHLHGGSAMDIWPEYVRRFKSARAPSAKMLLVDWVVHQLHISSRAVAINLIGGRPNQVMAMMDELAYGDGCASGDGNNRWRRLVGHGRDEGVRDEIAAGRPATRWGSSDVDQEGDAGRADGDHGGSAQAG